jgi:hypothetical protein
MSTVRVWKFTVFDFTSQRDTASSRYARSETISIIGGTPIRGSDILVDESDLDVMGMTKSGFRVKDT